MKMIVAVALALVAVAAAAPPPETKIVRSDFTSDDKGYNFAFETDDGTSRNEQGEVKEVLDEENKPHSVVIVRGNYAYINTDGKPETISYVADQDGYRAEGESIPKVASRR